MNTTIITYIHEELQHESIVVKHELSPKKLLNKLNKVFSKQDRAITLVDLVIFFMNNSEYEVVKNDIFFSMDRYLQSDLYKMSETEIQLSSDMELTIIYE